MDRYLFKDNRFISYSWIFYRNEKSAETTKSQKSRLQEFKQISVETFTMLKQKLQDAKKVNAEKLKPGSHTYWTHNITFQTVEFSRKTIISFF